MDLRKRNHGAALLVAVLVLLACIGAVFAVEIASFSSAAQRERASERALALAREALIAYAVDRPVNALVGPGYLPCPDLDGDGWAEATCGSLNGDTGQAQRLGRLPWKTLGLDDLRDGHGERLWYAVSTKYKGLLNCGASAACVDLTPDVALGTITVRDAAGSVLHDGTIADAYRANDGGAVAVVMAPGPALRRAGGSDQVRDCGAGECDPANYLDRARGERIDEDNADFVDRTDEAGRPRNANGFIQGPVLLPDGGLAVNDRVTAIAYRDLMPRIMARVAIEVGHCLRDYAARPENAGRYPWPSPLCAQADADPALAWQGRAGVHFGRIPATAPAATQPGADDTCRAVLAPEATHSWWKAWRPYVFYALSRGYSPDAARPSCDSEGACLVLVEPGGRVTASGKHFAVIVAGAPVARDGFVQARAGNLARIREWLEEDNARLEGAAGCPDHPPVFTCEGLGTCGRVAIAPATRTFNDVVHAYP